MRFILMQIKENQQVYVIYQVLILQFLTYSIFSGKLMNIDVNINKLNKMDQF